MFERDGSFRFFSNLTFTSISRGSVYSSLRENVQWNFSPTTSVLSRMESPATNSFSVPFNSIELPTFADDLDRMMKWKWLLSEMSTI